MIETSFISFCVSKYLLTIACPASWKAVNLLSLSEIINSQEKYSHQFILSSGELYAIHPSHRGL